MQVVRASSRDEVILEWLRSEWHGLQNAPPDTILVDPRTADPTDASQNAERARLLSDDRSVILNTIPVNMSTDWVQIEKEDLPKLYIIPSVDWYMDTGGTFRLIDTREHLRPGRGMAILPPGPVYHYDKVQEKSRYMRDNGIAKDEVFILISASLDGPYTIIEGNHRAVVLYQDHIDTPNTPWKGILIHDPEIANTRWFVNSGFAQGQIWQMGLFSSHGLLW